MIYLKLDPAFLAWSAWSMIAFSAVAVLQVRDAIEIHLKLIRATLDDLVDNIVRISKKVKRRHHCISLLKLTAWYAYINR